MAAEHDPKCEAKSWPFARGETKKDRMQIFSRVSKDKLVQYFFAEVGTMKDLSLVQDLSTYLIETETDPDRKEFYQSIVWATDPFQKDGGAKPMPIDMICKIEKDFKSHKSANH
jgi:hypothetical protein